MSSATTTLEQMGVNVEGKSSKQIEVIMRELDIYLVQNRKAELQALHTKIQDQVQEVGFDTIQDFLKKFEELNSEQSGKSTRKPVEPRYRNPNNPEETWTGRGKQPRWLVAALEEGYDLAYFLIAKPETTEESTPE